MKLGVVRALLRFSSFARIQEFAAGRLYLNSLAYFRSLEGDIVRSDGGEGLHSMFQVSKGARIEMALNPGDPYVAIPGLFGSLKFVTEAELRLNVFCMFAVMGEPSPEVLVDPRNFEFGDTFAFVHDGNEFLRRVATAAKAAGQSVKAGPVDYCDFENHHGPVGAFRKRSSFAYQREFRIALRPGTGNPLHLDVGSLEDIVSIGPMERVNDLLDIG